MKKVFIKALLATCVICLLLTETKVEKVHKAVYKPFPIEEMHKSLERGESFYFKPGSYIIDLDNKKPLHLTNYGKR